MVAVEVILAGPPPSAVLSKDLIKLVEEFLPLFTGYFENKVPSDDVINATKLFEGRLSGLLALAREARREPRWWKKPHKADFYDEVIRLLQILNSLLSNLAHVLSASSSAGSNRPVLMGMKSFGECSKELTDELRKTM